LETITISQSQDLTGWIEITIKGCLSATLPLIGDWRAAGAADGVERITGGSPLFSPALSTGCPGENSEIMQDSVTRLFTSGFFTLTGFPSLSKNCVSEQIELFLSKYRKDTNNFRPLSDVMTPAKQNCSPVPLTPERVHSNTSKIVINQISHIRHMNVEIGTEAAQFSEKKYINGIFVAVCTFQGFVPANCEANLFPD
jgi:hypothetical protein